MAGDSASAMCIMQMNEGLDTGDILLRRSFDIPADWNAAQLHDHTAALGAKMVLETLEHRHTLIPQAQSEDGITYASKITKHDARIDWNQPAQHILNHIRGLSPYPAATAMLGDELIKITQAELAEGSGAAGTVIDDALTIACGNGAIRLLELQRPGKNRMSAEALLNGFPIGAGRQFT
jgi:methionyl-tRNA formyltransferase